VRQAALYFANFQQRRAPADSGALAAGGAHPAADADVVRALVAEVATILGSARFGEALAVRARGAAMPCLVADPDAHGARTNFIIFC
jgi:hypothetical protein